MGFSLSLAFSWVRLLVTYRANHRERIGLAKGRMAMVFYDGSCRIVKNRIGLSLKGQETKNFKFRSGFYSCIACLSRVRTYIHIDNLHWFEEFSLLFSTTSREIGLEVVWFLLGTCNLSLRTS